MVTPRRAQGDRGAILVLTLILVVIMSVIVLGLLQFVTVGLTTSDVASERTETNADSANVMHWAIEQFAKKQYTPDVDCGQAPTYLAIAVPPSMVSNGSTTTLECAQTNPINGEPVVHLIARSAGDQNRVVEATVETPQYSHGARVADWRVDIPIVVPAYTTTTTTTPSTTTTTTTTAPNSPPFAADMSVTIMLDDPAAPPFNFVLPATDPEGDPMTIASLTTTDPIDVVDFGGGLMVELTATTGGGATAPATYQFQYEVQDTAVSNVGTVTVNVATTGPPTTSTTTTTTTTTLAPSPACTFTVTSAQNGGNSGIGVLEVTNSGGEFTGWTVEVSQLDPSRPWQFTWGAGVTATPTATGVRVSGGQTIGPPFQVSAGLTQSNGNPKIQVGQSLTCTVLSP